MCFGSHHQSALIYSEEHKTVRKTYLFKQRAEADIEDEIDPFFHLERLFALEDVHLIFLYV